MLGAIIGDTVGSAYEFSNTKDYDFRLFTSESDYTDDSVMTVAVASWLLRDPAHTHQGLEDAMLEFADTCPCPMGGYGTGFWTWLFYPAGLAPFDARYGKAPYPSRTGRHPYGSWGNGAAMRVSAVGWAFDTLEETERVAAVSAEITHNHPEGIKGAQATAAAVFLARTGKSREEIRDYIGRTYGYDLHKTWEYWHPVYHWEDSCQGTVPQALICFLDSTDFEDAIRKAVSLGGDSDTLACITGGVAEAFYREIPSEMEARVLRLLPQKFHETLDALREGTAYGRRESAVSSGPETRRA
jgi:ADP-ribosylglycohydrolase